MSNLNLSQINITTEQYVGLLERLFLSISTTVPCCVFLFINFSMLFILRSKTVFCETSRYILLYNLLFADTFLLLLSQIMLLLSASRLLLTYPVCGFLNMLAALTNEISPLTLVVMSLERYVAVCYPLRHASIITIRTTVVAIIVVWAISSLNVLIRVILLLQFPFRDLQSLQMTDLCSGRLLLLIVPMLDYFDKAYTSFVFVSAGLTVISSYIGVMLAARSASTVKASACKTRNTLLLHMMQLTLILSSTVQHPLLIAISRFVTRIVVVRIQVFFHVCLFIFPRCLASLIYGIRDQNIRPLLTFYLCCRLKLNHVIRG